MIKRNNVTLISNPICRDAIIDIKDEDFLYYDKDGFELNVAEQKFYQQSKFPLNNYLNHTCWQEPWFELAFNDTVFVDHSLFLCRACYSGEAIKQLESIKKSQPRADLLINTKMKWGYDFAIDAVNNGTVYEVIHIEYDSLSYDKFSENFVKMEYVLRYTDWEDAAKKIWQEKDKWNGLNGFEQNHWKAKFLLGWNKAEYTEKSI